MTHLHVLIQIQTTLYEVFLTYSHAFGVFFQGVLHVSELRLQTLNRLLQLQLLLLAPLEFGHLLVQLALHMIELYATCENHHVKYSAAVL